MAVYTAGGTLDDKGMIVASLYAMKAVKEQDIPLKKKIRLIIGTQEETSWTDMEKYTRSDPILFPITVLLLTANILSAILKKAVRTS